MADPIDPVIRAAGILLVAPTGRVLVLRRTDAGNLWSFPGGKVEEGEATEDAARRETLEETGTVASFTEALTPWTRRIKDGVDFTTFVGRVAQEFEPHLSDEHDLCKWVMVDEALDLPGLHPGCRVALIRDQLDELGLAKMMKMGELISPQRYQNLLLIALRVTGTGTSYRSRAGKRLEDGSFEGEYVYRDPKHYLTDEFLQRCQGLPVIWEHSPSMLDGKEFKSRAVGTVMLPYILGSEVWGISKVYDEAAAALLETEKLSTSPGVRVTGPKLPTEDGKVLLIEDNPTLLDHVAICEVGVWDKGGPPAGVLNQSTSGEETMADEKKGAEDRKDEAPKATLDDVMTHLHGLHGKMDSMKERQDGYDARLDSFEKKDGDKEEKKDAAGEDKKDADKDEKKDAAGEDKKDADKEEKKDSAGEDKKDGDGGAITDKKDSGGDEKKDAAGEDKSDSTHQENDSMTDRHDSEDPKALAKRVAALEAGAAPLSPEQQREFVGIQARADKAFQAHDSAAPRWLAGESALAYKKRLLREHLDRSPTWKGTDLDHINDAHTLSVIEAKVYTDSVDAARRPMPGGEPRLVRHVETDETGRKIVSYYGDAGVAWDPFKLAGRYLTGINKKFD